MEITKCSNIFIYKEVICKFGQDAKTGRPNRRWLHVQVMPGVEMETETGSLQQLQCPEQTQAGEQGGGVWGGNQAWSRPPVVPVRHRPGCLRWWSGLTSTVACGVPPHTGGGGAPPSVITIACWASSIYIRKKTQKTIYMFNIIIFVLGILFPFQELRKLNFLSL